MFLRSLLIASAMLSQVALAEVIQSVPTIDGPKKTGYLGLGANPVYSREVFSDEELPESFDWRQSQAVSSIKDQGSCGSCWSFAITKSLESALIVQLNEQENNLSEQQMVSCARDAFGCNGGFMTSAKYVVNKGLTDEKSYPYRGVTGVCKSGHQIVAKAQSYKLLGSSTRKPSVQEMKSAMVKYGPLFVTVAAGGSGWNGSRKEITGCKNRSTNHMVNLVGWTADGKWIMANSWGNKWADQGFALIKFGCDKIGDEAGYIVVQSN